MILIKIHEDNLSEYLSVTKQEFFTILESTKVGNEKELESILSDTMVLHDYGLDNTGYFVKVYMT